MYICIYIYINHLVLKMYLNLHKFNATDPVQSLLIQ